MYTYEHTDYLIPYYLLFKVECNPDIHVLSVNGGDQEDLTVKVWAKLDNPFLSYGFLKF